jgi:Ca-activated chloride channel family protein
VALRIEAAVTWRSPQWLWALLALPLLGVAMVAWARDRKKAAAQYADPRLIDLRPPRRVRMLRITAAVCAVLATGLGIVAMARPARSIDGKETRSTIMLAVDTSKSMLDTDLTPNRLGAAVEAARRFLDVAPKDAAIGFVTFSNGAVVRVSPSTDRDQVRRAFDNLPIAEGTAIGDAVLASLSAIQGSGALAEVPESPDASPARILLLTDGANSAGSDPLAAAARAAELRVPIYTILLGNDAGRPDGLSPTETLTALANQTKGVFTPSNSTEDLKRVFEDIGVAFASVRRLDELTVWAVLGAIVLLVLAAAAIAGSEIRPRQPELYSLVERR